MQGVRVHILGGEINAIEESSSGIDVLQAAENFRFDLAFLGTGGVTINGEITDFTRNGAELRSRMAVNAGEAWFLASAEKFGRMTPLRVAHFEQAAGILTDRQPEALFVSALSDKGLIVRVA
jgi:DeoR/GlpR family transcriptional regulator of sugar metabolism